MRSGPPTSSGKTLVLGVRHYRVPGLTLGLGSIFTPRSLRAVHTSRPHRLRAVDYPRAYRAHPLRLRRFPKLRSAKSSPAQLSSGPGFPGLADNGSYPADTQVAVGSQQIVEMTNTLVGIYGRDGRRLENFPMTDTLGNAGDDVSDPQIAWDPTSGTWLAAAMNLSTNSTQIAISDSSDPRGVWWDYSYSYGSAQVGRRRGSSPARARPDNRMAPELSALEIRRQRTLLVIAAHLDQVVNRARIRLRGQLEAHGGADDPAHTQIDVRRQPAVQANLLETHPAPAGRCAVVQERQHKWLLQLVGTLADQEDPRDVCLAHLDRARLAARRLEFGEGCSDPGGLNG